MRRWLKEWFPIFVATPIVYWIAFWAVCALFFVKQTEWGPAIICTMMLLAGAFWTVWIKVTQDQLHRAHRKGVCIFCGYDWRGLDKCPECGFKRGGFDSWEETDRWIKSRGQ